MLVKGKIYWAKILGEPQPGYDKSKKEWSFDLVPDEEGMKLFNSNKALKKRLKEREDDDRGVFTTFKRKELKMSGEANRPIPVVDKFKNPWPQDKLIGNESEVVVQFRMIDTDYGEQPSVQKVLILDHVEYEGADEFGDYYQEPDEEDWDDE